VPKCNQAVMICRYFPTLEALLHSALASGKSIANLVIFILIFVLCFAVTGRYIFLDTMETRSSFSTFYISILTVFQLLTGDSWSNVVYHAMNTFEAIYAQFLAALFMMVWFIFAKLIIVNLFVAVIIENFEVSATIENIQRPGYVNNFRQLLARSYQKVLPRFTNSLHSILRPCLRACPYR
jgi:voltage-dependent calcium channel L type alpha-1D